MTLLDRQHTNKNYYISMEWNKNNLYVVQVCPRINENLCGYPIKEMTYAIYEREKALATFRRYIKKYI